MQRWPSPKAMKRIQTRVHELTQVRRNAVRTMKELVEKLNPVLRGWGNYFRTGNASIKFQQVDRYVSERLVRLMYRGRRDRHRPFRSREWTPARFHKELGLHRLLGTIRYPGSANAA